MGEAPSSPSPEGSAAVRRAPPPRATRPLRRVVERLQSVDGVVAKLEGALAVLATFGMVTLVALPMVIRALPTGSWARGLFGDYSWMAQGARFLLTWATFAGASLATRARAHIVVDLVTKLVPGRARAALNVVAALLASLLCLILAGVATYVVWANWSQASVLRGVDKGKAHAIIPVALAVMAARFALVALEDLDGARSGDLAYMRRAEREAQEAHGMVLPEEPGAAAGADVAAPASAAPNPEQEARP